MLKKVLYVILAIAFLIGTHLIAQEQNVNLGPSARPSVSVNASENGAKAIASLNPLRAMELPVGDTISFTGKGEAYARVLYYISEDDNGSEGSIAITLTAILKEETSTTTSSNTKKTETSDHDVEVDVGAKLVGKIPISAGVDVEVETEATEETEDVETTTTTRGFVKEVWATHDNVKAEVGGKKNNFKYCSATAKFTGEPDATDCQTYRPSIFEFYEFWH